MASIHWSAFMIIGAIVSIVSYFLVEELFVFTYVGLAFIVWGLLKLIYKKLTAPKNPKPHHQHKKHRVHHPHCPFCNIIIKPHDNFCSHCGGYLKHQRGNPNLNNSRNHQNPQGYQNQVRRVP